MYSSTLLWSVLFLLVSSVCAHTALTLRTIDKGTRSDIGSARQVVVRSDAEWLALWREHRPDANRPAVDLSKEMVAAVFLGSRPTAGYSVAIVAAEEADGALRIRYRETSPPRDAITAQVITFPYHIVAIPKSSAGDVKFEKEK